MVVRIDTTDFFKIFDGNVRVYVLIHKSIALKGGNISGIERQNLFVFLAGHTVILTVHADFAAEHQAGDIVGSYFIEFFGAHVGTGINVFIQEKLTYAEQVFLAVPDFAYQFGKDFISLIGVGQLRVDYLVGHSG